MTAQIKAALQTAYLIAGALVFGTIVSFAVTYLGADTVLTIGMIGILVFLIQMVYTINLRQIQYKEKLTEPKNTVGK